MNPLEINPLRATRFAHLDAIGSARLTIGWRGVKHSGRELSKQGVAREVGDEYTRSEDGRPNLLTLRPAILIRTSDATTFRRARRLLRSVGGIRRCLLRTGPLITALAPLITALAP